MPSLRDSKYKPSSIPGLNPRAIKCRRSATENRKTYVYASLEFLKYVPLSDSHGCARGTVASAKTASNWIFTSLETLHSVAVRGQQLSMETYPINRGLPAANAAAKESKVSGITRSPNANRTYLLQPSLPISRPQRQVRLRAVRLNTGWPDQQFPATQCRWPFRDPRWCGPLVTPELYLHLYQS